MPPLDEFQDRVRDIVTSPRLTYRQRIHQLALAAEDLLPYPKLSNDAERALADGLVCDLAEGHAPYRPRYVLPDYAKALQQGSEYLELDPPETLEEAIDFLKILYHHVPSITGLPVYFGDLDTLLGPFLDETWTDERLDRLITRLWRFLDRTIPDAFAHANVGPVVNPITHAVLRVDRHLGQVVPNLTLKWDPDLSGDEILREAARAISEVNKPHIANDRLIRTDFPEGYGVVSCYNTLPLGGGSHTLVRLNLFASLNHHAGTVERYLTHTLPEHVELTFEVMEARIRFLVEEAGFYEHSFLVSEGLIHPHRFTAMFGIFGVAELVDHILTVAPHHRRFPAGISDIFALERSVRANPEALTDVTKGAFQQGMREITFNVEGSDLVRVTGYMVRLSDIEKLRQGASRINSTGLGADSVENWHLLDRIPRVIGMETDPRMQSILGSG